MYSEGSGKALLSLFIGLILVVAACFWHQTLFLLKVLKDLIVIDSRLFFQNLLQRLHGNQ